MIRSLFILITFSATIVAADLAELKAEHQADLAELDVPLVAWDERYKQELKKLERQAQTAGDLELLILIRQELESFGGVRPEIPDSATALKRLRSIYDRQAASLGRDRATQLGEKLRTHVGKLTTLQQTLTRSGPSTRRSK